MAKKMLIDATHAEETRVVVVDGNKVEEFDFESENRRQLAGNIYLAKVTRVEPSLQAAFVDYGGNRHGFLAFSEIHADYYQIPVADREALMAEEYAFAEAQKTQDEDEEKPKTPSRRRGLSESKATSVQTSDATTAADINGMETIDLEEIINDSDIDGNVTTEISHEVSNNISIDSEDNQTGQIVSEKISDKDDLGGEDQPDETIESVVNEDDSEDIRPTR
ncbi:MAG: S1 RNA-binding domain-containing protein [Alphaproteobacteria bacterium]|nr:S1 RNA-binding domain-containing protein [Alphaproteobacteria bacterium]